MDGPVDVIIAPRCRGQASMGDHHSGGICRGTPTTPGRHGFWFIDSGANDGGCYRISRVDLDVPVATFECVAVEIVDLVAERQTIITHGLSLPLLSYLGGSKSVYTRPSDPDTKTVTALECILLCRAAKNGKQCHWELNANQRSMYTNRKLQQFAIKLPKCTMKTINSFSYYWNDMKVT